VTGVALPPPVADENASCANCNVQTVAGQDLVKWAGGSAPASRAAVGYATRPSITVTCG